MSTSGHEATPRTSKVRKYGPSDHRYSRSSDVRHFQALLEWCPLTRRVPRGRCPGFRLAFADSGDARRARARRKSGNEGRPGDLHFPIGGHRFRPCLEDVLQMLIEEFGVDVPAGWRENLMEGRGMWREIQRKAPVSDHPEAAAQALEALGFGVEWMGEGERQEWRPSRLEAY